jgi:hypothetical protein
MYALLLAAMQIAAPGVDSLAFIAVSAAGENNSGQIVRMFPDFTVVLATGNKETTIKDIISLRRGDLIQTHLIRDPVLAEVPLPPLPNGPHLITTTGDRIAGKLLGGDSQSLTYLPSSISRQQGKKNKAEEPWRVPLSSTAVLWFTSTPADTPIEPAQYDWMAGNRNRDVFRYRNGDMDKGSLVGLDEDVRFNFKPEQGMARTLRMEELAAVGFNPSLARNRKPKGAYARIVLTDSSRLDLLTPTIEDGLLKGETRFGLRVAIPVSELLSLDILQGKATYLSDLKPKKVEQTGFLGVIWPWKADRNVQGKPLRVAIPLGESTYDKGLGTHPRTLLSYDLGAKYRRFEALVGFDPQATIRGCATVQVVLDGKVQELGDRTKLRSGNAIPIRIDTRGARELVLITDFSTTGDVGADVNWCEARVIE